MKKTKLKTIGQMFKKRCQQTHTCLQKIFLVGIILITNVTVRAQTLTLEQCIGTALQYNRNIKLSEQDIYLATEKNKETRGNLIPKIVGLTDYRYYTDLPYQIMPAAAFGGEAGTYKEVQFGVPQSLNANLQVTVPIYNPTALGAVKNTRIAAELSELQKIKTEEDVVMEVSNAYYNAQILLNQMSFLNSNMMNTRELVQTTILLHQQQLAKGTDVDRLQLQLEQITNQRNTVSSQQHQVLNSLNFLMGKPISDSIQVLINEKATVVMNYKSQLTTVLLLIDKKNEVNTSELRALRNSILPTLGLYGVYGTTGFGTTGSNSFFNFHPIGYVGAQLSVPIFNGLITKHRIAQKRIDIQKTNIQKELVAEKSKLDMINAEMQYTLASQNMVTVGSQINLAKKIYDNTVLQNKLGMASITDLILADNSLRDAQQNYIIALVSLRKSELEYKRVTGNLIPIKN